MFLTDRSQPLYNRGIDYPMIIVGVVASILVAVGLLPPYYEMWKRRGRVVGISLWFIFIDLLGAFFSLMALGMFDPAAPPLSIPQDPSEQQTNSHQSPNANSTSSAASSTSPSSSSNSESSAPTPYGSFARAASVVPLHWRARPSTIFSRRKRTLGHRGSLRSGDSASKTRGREEKGEREGRMSRCRQSGVMRTPRLARIQQQHLRLSE